MVRPKQPTRVFFASLLGLLASALAAVPTLGGAPDEPSGKTILESAADADSKNLQGSDLGTGSFARSPFRVSVSVREGYDDNVYTTNQNRVDSFFTNGNVAIGYKFGDARTRLDLEVSGGA